MDIIVFCVEQPLQHIAISILRIHAYILLQCHPFIASTPKTYLCARCSRSSLFWHLKFVTDSVAEECFTSSALLLMYLYFELRSLPAQLVSVLSFVSPLPSPSSLESCTTSVPVQHGR
ncbi:hypothetical protein BDR03DRAFT_973928 [Suillus americanus]|nr:hypothetical protein BDR03DRAFT_973928 [Suillus americanus]